MAKKKKKNKSGAVQQLAPPSADQAAAAAAAAAAEASQVVVETPEEVGSEEHAAEDYAEETYAEEEAVEGEATGEESTESGTVEATNRGAFRGRGRGFMMRGGRFIPPHMMRGMVPFHPAMMRGRPGFRPPPPHMMRGMFRPRGPFPPGFRPPRMRPGFRPPWPVPPRGRGGFQHGAPHGEYSEEGYEEENEDGEYESPVDSNGASSTVITHSRSAPTTPSQPRKFEPRAQPYRGTFPPRGGQFRPRGQFPGQRPNYQRPFTPRFSATGSNLVPQSYTPRPRHPPPATHHPPPHIPSSTSLTSLPPPGLPPPTRLPPPVHPHSLPPPTNQPPPAIIQQPPFGVPGMPPPMSGPPPLGQPPPALRLTSPAPGQVILSTGHPTLLPHLHTSTAGGLAHHTYTAGVQQPPPGLPPPSHLIQPTLTLLGHQQPQLATIQPSAASYVSVAAAGGQQLLVAPPPIVPTGHQPPPQLQVAPPPVVSVGGAIPSHYPPVVPGAPGGVLPPPSAATGALALPTHVPVSAVGPAVAADRTSSRGSSASHPPSVAGSSSGQKSGSVRSVSPTAKEALKFIYSCKTTDQMSTLPTCIFCSEPQTSMNDHLYSRHWHKLFVCLVVRSTGNRCKHAFVYVNELTDHITQFHGINDVDVNKFVTDNHIQLPENLKLFICKLCPSGKAGIHLEHKELIYNHINKKHPEVKCTYDNIIRFECRACHKFDFQNYENLLSHIERRHSSRQVTADSRGSSSASGARSSSSYYHEHAAGTGGGTSSSSSSRGYEEHRSRRDDYQDYDRSRKRRYEDERGSDERYKQPRSDRDYSDHRRSGGSASASAGSHHESSSSRYQDRSRDDYRRSQPPAAAVDQRHHHAAASHHHHIPAHLQDVSGKSAVAAAPAAAVAVAEPISDTLDLDEAFLVRTQRKDGVGGGRRHNATDGDGIVILK